MALKNKKFFLYLIAFVLVHFKSQRFIKSKKNEHTVGVKALTLHLDVYGLTGGGRRENKGKEKLNWRDEHFFCNKTLLLLVLLNVSLKKV